MKPNNHSRGFTLIELLVVIAIIAVLSVVVFAGMSSARSKSNLSASQNNLRQWGIALNQSLGDYDNRLPSTGVTEEKVDIKDENAWFNRLAKYVNELPLSDSQAVEKFPKHGRKSIWVNPAVPPEDFTAFSAPPEKWLFSYAMNGWLSTIADPTMSKARIVSATSTVFMGEQGTSSSQLKPEEIRAYYGVGNVVESRDGAANFLFCDGHVELVIRTKFDKRFMIEGQPSPVDTKELNPGFSYVPHEGALED